MTIRYSTDHPGNTYSDATDADRARMTRLYDQSPEIEAQRDREAVERVRIAMQPRKATSLTIKRKHAAALGGRKDQL